MTIGVGNDYRDSIRCNVPVDALMSNIQTLATAVEQLPEPGCGVATLSVGKTREVSQLVHGQSFPMTPVGNRVHVNV